jgi:D-amino-acid dehydrogenase
VPGCVVRPTRHTRHDGPVDHTQVVVVGGGVAGASAAFALVQAGAHVTVVDADETGRATSAGAGIVQPWASATTGPLYDLYAAGAAHYPQLIDALADAGVTDIGFRRTGALVVNADHGALDQVSHRLDERRRAAPFMGTVTRVDAAEARRLFPPLAEGMDGIHIAGGARVDGRLLCRGLLDAVARLGGAVVGGRVSLQLDGDRPQVLVDGRLLDADAVVVAGGAWSRALMEPIGVPIELEPQRGQIVHLRLDGADTSAWPSISPLADHYMVSFDDSRVVVGATRETGSGFDPRVTAGGLHHVLSNALAVAPGLAAATIVETRVGLRPMPPDGMPIVGRFEGLDGLYVTTGFGAIGLTIAPFCGQALADMIVVGGATGQLAAFAPRANC